MLELLSFISPFVATLIATFLFIICITIIYTLLSNFFENLVETKKVNVYEYYGPLVFCVYLFYLPILKIGGVNNLNNPPTIIAAYMVALAFVSVPRFFVFDERLEYAKNFGFLIATAIFMAILVCMVRYVKMDIPSFISTFVSKNILSNIELYLVLGAVGIGCGLIIERCGKSVLDKIKFALDKLKKKKGVAQ